MSPDQWSRAFELFHELIDAHDQKLAAEQELDPEVRREALRLLAHHQESTKDSFLEPPLSRWASLDGLRFEPGQILVSRFRIVRKLGEGGMGEVYEAEDTLLGERVAVKTIRAGLHWDENASSRFLNEVQTARRVTHPNVCRIHDCFKDENLLFLSMELVDGKTLGSLIDDPELDDVNREKAAVQIGRAIAAVHECGLVHGDLKPGNVLVARNGANEIRAVVTDFGLAKMMTAAVASESKAGFAGGTKGYMAPEIAAGGAHSVRSDLFAFGRILQKLLPQEPFAARCVAENPALRPKAITDWEKLRPDSGVQRRTVLWSLGAAVAAALPASYFSFRRGRRQLLVRERSILNPLRGNAGAKIQPYVEYCFRQSAMIGLLPMVMTGSQPVKDLLAYARKSRAKLVLDGESAENAGRLELRLAAFDVESEREQAVVRVEGRVGADLAELASDAVRQMRLELGERKEAIGARWRISATTSADPQAVMSYFDGLQKYEDGEPAEALQRFDRALQLDPAFPMAHFGRSRALSNLSRETEALAACESAMVLREKLAEGQKQAIECLYATQVNDFEKAAELYQRLILIEPEQAGAWYRQIGNLLGLAGKLDPAIVACRKAVEADPVSQMNWSALALLQAESGDAAGALATVAESRTRGLDHPSLLWGESQGRVAEGKTERAWELLQKMAQSAAFGRIARFQSSQLKIWIGRFREAAVELETDLFRDENDRHPRWVLERQLRLAQIAREVGDSPKAQMWLNRMGAMDLSPSFVESRIRALGLAADLDMSEAISNAVPVFEEIQKRWPCPVNQAAAHLARTAKMVATSDGKPESTIAARGEAAKAFGLWPDPHCRLIFGRMLRLNGELEESRAVLEPLSRLIGTILQREYPGLIVQSWFETARALEGLSDSAGAKTEYARVLNQWAPQTGAQVSGLARTNLMRKEKERL